MTSAPDRSLLAPRKPLGLALALLLACFLCACSEKPVRRGRAPVIVILFDALHAAHVGHLGYARDTTPHLDQLAQDGLSFETALAPAPYTLASIPSLLTGRLPDEHGLTRKSRLLKHDEVTLPEVLRGAGYRTYGAVANPNGSSLFGVQQGFDVFLELFREGEHDVVGRSKAELEDDAFRLAPAPEFVGVLDTWIEAQEGRAPFLFYLHVLEPHAPYTPPEPHRSRWIDPDYDGPFREGDPVVALRGGYEPTPADRAAALDLYDGNLAFADAILGQMVARLRDAGLYEESLIVVTSDHGEAFWQHGQWGHNDTLFDEMLRVPLVVKLPGPDRPRGAVVEGLASIVDLVPSLCNWLGVPVPPRVDGLALGALVAGDPSFADRELLLRTNADRPDVALRTPWSKSIGSRREPGQQGFVVEHFDLRADPAETQPLDDGAYAPGATQRERVEEWARTIHSRDRQRRAERRNELSQDAETLLEKLGYSD